MTISQWKEAAFRRREAEMLERLLENEAAIIPLVAGLSSILITVPSWKKNPYNIYLRGF